MTLRIFISTTLLFVSTSSSVVSASEGTSALVFPSLNDDPFRCDFGEGDGKTKEVSADELESYCSKISECAEQAAAYFTTFAFSGVVSGDTVKITLKEGKECVTSVSDKEIERIGALYDDGLEAVICDPHGGSGARACKER